MTSPEPDLVELTPEVPAYGGSAVARHQGRAVMVDLALPGEVVQAGWRGRRGGVDVARVERIKQASPWRVEPSCPHFGVCGGCQWQHAAYPYQLQMKRRVVADAWSRQGLRLPADTPVLGMQEPWRYRIRGEFEVVPGPPLRFGFHQMRSHRLLAIETCPIHDLRIERALEAFRQVLAEAGAPGLQNLLLTVEPTGSGLLWRARFRNGRGTLGADLAARVGELVPDLVLLDDSMSLQFWGLTFRVRSDSFVQTNYRQMLVLYETALEMLNPSPRDSILDLYAGIGTITLTAARQAARVIAVEENPSSVGLAQLNSRINLARNVSFLPGKVETVLRRIRIGEHSAAILDPPRAGCEVSAIAELVRLGLDRLVYVSCDPITQARDLAALVRGGYRVRRAAVVDMFPHTYHVESVALLERSPC